MNGFDGLLSDPMLAMGIGLLGGNQGVTKGAAFGNAMQGGLLSAQQSQQMQAMMAMRQMQAEALKQKQAQLVRQQAMAADMEANPAKYGLTPETARLYAATGEGGLLKGAEQPGEVREYEFAKGQGFNGSFLDYQMAKRQAGATSVNVAPTFKLPGNVPGAPGGYYYTNPQGITQGEEPILKPLPQGPADPTTTEKYRDRVLGINRAIDALDTLRGMVSQHGAEVIPGAAKERMGTAYNNLINEAKELYGMGALQEAEFKQLERTFRDPTSMKAKGLEAIGVSPAEQLNTAAQIFANAKRRVEEAYRLPGGPGPVLAPGTRAPKGPWEKY